MALGLYRTRWLSSYALLLAGLAIDLDHLLASPIYSIDRCSVGFHPLHTAIPVAVNVLALLPPKTRLLGIGLCIHILLDAIDCKMTSGVWYV